MYFQETRIKVKHLEEKLSRNKNLRGLTSTTNHRFIALMVRWGKKSKSYNVYLNALSHCKQMFDLSNQSVSKDTIKIVDSVKSNKNQNSPSKFSVKNRVINPSILTEKIALAKDIISVSTLDSDVDIYRGTWNRFQKSLLLFYRNPKNAFTACFSKRGLQVKVRFSENLYYSLTGLCRTALLNSQIKEEHTLLLSQIHSSVQQFSVNKRLISRRVGLKVVAAPELLKQSITTKRNEIEGIIFRGLVTDSLFVGLTSVLFVSNLLRKKRTHLNSIIVSSYLKREQFTDLPTFTRGAHDKLIDYAQGSKDQDFIAIPPSVLVKKKNINAKTYRGVYGVECIRIGIDSVSKVSPSVEVRKVRIGGATYAVPYVPHKSRQEGLGIRWLIACASLRKERSKYSSEFCLANELADSLKNQGESIKKRDQSHQIAVANRAYTRYRWW